MDENAKITTIIIEIIFMDTENKPFQIKDGCSSKQAVHQIGIITIHLTFNKTKNEDP
jgi:hypothetical protein